MNVRATIVAIVDDDALLLESLSDLLASKGYDVRCYQSARALLDSEELPSLECVITDISMPEIDGFELQKSVQITHPRLPVIFITGNHEPKTEKRISTLPPNRFFRKPFDTSKLLTAVSDAILKTR